MTPEIKSSCTLSNKSTEPCICPFCSGNNHSHWASELNYTVVRCTECRLLFVCPLPPQNLVDEAVRTGLHKHLGLNVTSRRIPSKRRKYKKIFQRLFSDILENQIPIIWIDVGSGYGEVLEAVRKIAPNQSRVIGFEPMQPKALAARSLSLEVINSYLTPGLIKADVISVVDIFSHIPDFHSFLQVVSSNLTEGGLLFVETGNLADLKKREQFPGDLGLPDHLVFAGESTLRGYLQQAGFEIEATEYERTDTILDFLKNIAKRILGRPVALSFPYTSEYRQIRIRARLKSNLLVLKPSPESAT